MIRFNSTARSNHRALCHQSSKKIGDAECQLVSNRYFGCSQQDSYALVANVAEDPANNGDKRDDRSRFEDLLLLSQRGSAPGRKSIKNNRLTGISRLT